MSGPERVGVVGGGLGGLAAAITLAARGVPVTLFERGPSLGGKAARLEVDGFSFDVGPTIVTLPSALRRILAEAGERLEDHLDLVPIDPQWRAFYDGGRTLDLVADPSSMARNLEAFAGADDARGFRAFLERARRMHDLSRAYAFWRPVAGLGELLRAPPRGWAALPGDLAAASLHRSAAGLIRAHVADPRVAQLLDHFCQYVGSAPDASPAVLCGIAHMQSSEGVHYPRGGVAAIARALARVATGLGVEARVETPVRRLLLDAAGRVAGVETEVGEAVALRAVVSNADAGLTHERLLDGRAARAFARRERACSGVVLYLGLSRRYPQLAHHNFVFSADPHAELEQVFRRGVPAADPTCYVCAPSGTEPGVAPPGGEALYVLVHVPYLREGQDWARLLPGYRRAILDALARRAGLTDLEERIVVERVMTPEDIERRFAAPRGAIYGFASHGRLGGAFKPSNRSAHVPGLYLGGGSAHPGPGVPMALMSGWIAADCAARDLGAAAGSPAVLGAPRGR